MDMESKKAEGEIESVIDLGIEDIEKMQPLCFVIFTVRNHGQWVKKKDPVYKHQKNILNMIRNIAYADDMESFNNSLKILQKSEIWQKKNLFSGCLPRR